MKILLADDTDFMRDGLCGLFQALGLEVLVAEDAKSALGWVDQNQATIDIVFTDYEMPGMDGAELVRQIRARGFTRKIILSSGKLNDDQTGEPLSDLASRAGADHFLYKPFKIQEFKELLPSPAP